jgi:hypothetical protein
MEAFLPVPLASSTAISSAWRLLEVATDIPNKAASMDNTIAKRLMAGTILYSWWLNRCSNQQI